jgi:hypothetical protein
LGASPPPEIAKKLEVNDEVQALCEQTRHLVVRIFSLLTKLFYSDTLQLQDDRQFSLHGEWSPWVNMGPSRPAITTPITPASRSDSEPDTTDYRSAVYAIPNAWRRYLPEDAVIDVEEHDR